MYHVRRVKQELHCDQTTVRQIASMMRTETDALGFIPFAGIRRSIRNGWVFVALSPEGLIGYAICSRPRVGGITTINQICVRKSWRRKGVGTAIVRRIEKEWRGDLVKLSCASDLEANHFWEAMGAECRAIEPRSNRRRRGIYRWQICWVGVDLGPDKRETSLPPPP